MVHLPYGKVPYSTVPYHTCTGTVQYRTVPYRTIFTKYIMVLPTVVPTVPPTIIATATFFPVLSAHKAIKPQSHKATNIIVSHLRINIIRCATLHRFGLPVDFARLKAETLPETCACCKAPLWDSAIPGSRMDKIFAWQCHLGRCGGDGRRLHTNS